METFLIDVPMPSMGATVNELTVIALKVQAGDRVTKGQKIAELESDKSVFEFECPCDGTVRAATRAAARLERRVRRSTYCADREPIAWAPT